MLFTNPHFDKKIAASLRYWLIWLLFIAAIAIAMHGYLDFRTRELDKRIERLKT